jgi:general secretion pathway protein L
MRHSLLIRLHNEVKQVSWAIFDAAGRVLESATRVAIDTVPKRSAWVLIPGTEVLLTQADIPSKQWQRIVQAVPYALEEQLVAEVENLHFAVGKRDPQSGLIAVAVIARARLVAYLQQLNAAGITPILLMPDILAVPKPVEGWGVLYFDNVVLVRSGLYAGFAIEPSNLGVVLPIALRDSPGPSPSQITVFKGPQTVEFLTELRALGLPLKEASQESGELAWLAQGIVANNPLNLLQGDYRPRDKVAMLWRPWRLTVALLIIWGGFQVGKQWLEYQELKQQYQAITVAIEKVYRDSFPEARKIVNPRVQMEQQLQALRRLQGRSTLQEEMFLALFNQMSTPLKQTVGLELKRLDYRQGVFNVDLEVTNWQELEQLKQRLSNLGLTAKIQAAANRNNRIESRLRIQKSQ